MDALPALTPGTTGRYATNISTPCFDSAADGGRRTSLLKGGPRIGSGPNCRLPIEKRRAGVRTCADDRKRRRSKITWCSAPAAGNRNNSALQRELGPADFVFAEKVLHLWRTTQPRKHRESSWVSEVATTRIGELVGKHEMAEENTLSTESEPSPNDDASIEFPKFDWKTNWYPVSAEVDLDKTVPYPFQILGRKVVFWYGADNKWSCVLDACPHRLAPLSEGRIDEHGCIQCSYHGWSFRADGSCASIPQARKEGPEAKACEQGKSRAVVLPVVVKQGILFVWPDENSTELANQTEPPTTPGVEEDGWCAVQTARDLPYGYGVGMENVLDPSHVPVTHHKVNGGIMGTRDQATVLDLALKMSGPTGFETEWRKSVGEPSTHTFQAPARFTYAYQLRNIKGARALTTTYCTPTAPGYCRIVIVNARNFMIGLSSGPHWWQLFPRWLDHQMMNNLMDGDATLLQDQERNLSKKTNGELGKWNKAYFMPATADRNVVAFRDWLVRFGGTDVQWAEGVDPSLPPRIHKREDLLDRYTTHTKQCKVCSEALKNFELSRKVLFVLAAVLLGVGAVLANPASRIQAVGFAALAGVAGWRLGGWIQTFYYTGYDHGRIP